MKLIGTPNLGEATCPLSKVTLLEDIENLKLRFLTNWLNCNSAELTVPIS